ncbi:hypothetical protein [Williamsia sp. CHRR-6]|uniref:hypothetical protein n=1 Tax=Williamsia sp. CHRR-6 TaxID=2835871 RepID=UPI001BD9AE23|nr:hypothetical protein [Williamsia sp. CHRR-6]MBT0566148.1 hypothetical protein [Williamsia sp. CHRR-6]
MRMRIALAAAGVSLATVAGLVTAAPASAAPAPEKINYTAKVQGQSILFTTTAGSLRTANGQFQVVDSVGRVVVAYPLTYSFNNVALPIKVSAKGRSATLTPQLPDLRRNAAAPTTRAERDQQALAVLGSNVSTSVTIGSLVGTILGCVVGLLGAVVGCVPGAGIGAVAGTIIAGGPTLIAAAVQYFNTIRAPFKAPPKVAAGR